MLREKERLMAAVEAGVEFCPGFVVEKLTRLSWLIARADEKSELQAYAEALGVVTQQRDRVLN